jgi:uncharacterized protein YkwD
VLGLGLPLPQTASAALQESAFVQTIEPRVSFLSQPLNEIFGELAEGSAALLKVQPQTGEGTSLPFMAQNAVIDESAEGRMLELLNRERMANGLQPLVQDESLRYVARLHSRDMILRGYFAHFSPDGSTPFTRMAAAGVIFGYAAENLALAPSVEVAHTNLMNSPGHRQNILSANYNRVGIGILSAGSQRMLFTQDFAD